MHEIFFKMNLHPEGLIFGYFWLKNGFPDLKKPPVTNSHAFSCRSIHVANNFLKSGGRSPFSAKISHRNNSKRLSNFKNLLNLHHFLYSLTLWRLAAFGNFRKKNRLNARGFARECLRSCMGYGPGWSVKRCGKSLSALKKIFAWGGAVFLWMMS